MICKTCGNKLAEGAAFCENCGMPAESALCVEKETPASQKTGQSRKVTENIWLCPDGVYRWIYEYDMLRNPAILLTVWKALGVAFAVVYLFTLTVDLVQRSVANMADLWAASKVFAILAAVFLIISALAYIIVAALYGWKYHVLFEMTEDHVTHIQMPKQFRQAEAIGWLTALAGSATGKPYMLALGSNVTAKNASISEFKRVEIVKVRRRHHTIHVNQLLDRNQVYAEDEDFDFVEKFILARCTKAKVR